VDFESFRESLAGAPPAGLSMPLRVLWHERAGDWDTAHAIAQEMHSAVGAWLHAYLHRREGDLPNAAYWYHSAGKPVAEGPLDDEWEALCRQFLD